MATSFFLANKKISIGELCQLIPVKWRSWRLRRVAVSSGCAQIQRIVESKNGCYRLRWLWSEVCGQGVPSVPPHLFDRAAKAVDLVPGLAASDRKGGYDAIVVNAGAQLGLSEVRTAVQVFALKEACGEPSNKFGWLAGLLNSADGLTKPAASARATLLVFTKTLQWKSKCDPTMVVIGQKLQLRPNHKLHRRTLR